MFDASLSRIEVPLLMLPESSAFENVTVGAMPVETPVAPGAGVVETTSGGDPTTVTVIAVGGVCWFPLLSTARLLIDAGPGEVGVQLKLQEFVPVAALKVAPPSTDTSTLTTDPPPVSLAVPVMVTVVTTATVAPAVGEVIVEVGG